MQFTQSQISEILGELANEQDGFNKVMEVSLEAIMKSEQRLFQGEHDVYANGYRSCKVYGMGKELSLSVPRTRTGGFYPKLLAVLRDEDDERNKLVSSLYTRGLTTEQVGKVFEEVYGKHYSKSQVSYLLKDSKASVDAWLNRGLDVHYQVIYIDATYVSTRRDSKVSKEAYYAILGIKEDGTREVLAVVNHPTEGSLLWEQELRALRARGLQSVGLVVSDGLNHIENATSKVFPGSAHQLCVFHFKKNISAVFPKKHSGQIQDELREVFPTKVEGISPIDGYQKLCKFVEKWEGKYPSLSTYKSERNIYYFTYLNYPKDIQNMIYTTNWIERLNRDFKRVLKMRGALPKPESVVFLMGAVSMEKTETSYSYALSQFKNIEQLKRKKIEE